MRSIKALNPDQFAFSFDLARLVYWVYGHKGWTLTEGESYRPPEMQEIYFQRGIGIRGSMHGLRLAKDYNLFIDGIMQYDTAAYQPLGKYWESLSPQNRWGGRFKDALGKPKPDGVHFERAVRV